MSPEASARLAVAGYVFPIFGPVSFGDSFGAPRPCGRGWLAPRRGHLRAPGCAGARGRRRLRSTPSASSASAATASGCATAFGNEFYYAHPRAFTPLAIEGSHSSKPGDVIGFVGDTGDAEGGSPHLHFEIHPAAMLGLGDDGVGAPYPILVAWGRAEDISFSAGRIFVPVEPGRRREPSRHPAPCSSRPTTSARRAVSYPARSSERSRAGPS